MVSNFDSCPHCSAKGTAGILVRLNENTPVVRRSDGKTFHLFLFDGPAAMHGNSGGIVAGRSSATFFYASDTLDMPHGQVTVIIRTTDLDRDGVIGAVETAADLLSKILASGQRPEGAYFFDSGQLSVYSMSASSA